MKAYIDDQEKWIDTQVAKNPKDDFWRWNEITRKQMAGMSAGYKQTVSPEQDVIEDLEWGVRLVNYPGDLFDIIPAVLPQKRPVLEDMTIDELTTYQRSSGHCSAILRLADDNSDIFFGHSSWFVYSDMLRYYKTYDLSSLSIKVPSKLTSFSSYPGMVSSLDDFYLNHQSGLSMLQTTNNVFTPELYDLITPQTLPAFYRVRAANALSKTGEEWYNTVKRDNSGTQVPKPNQPTF